MSKKSYDDEWQVRILEWKASGQSAHAWTQEQGIDLSVFGFWYRRLFPEEVPPTQRFHPNLSDYPFYTGVVFERRGVLLHVPGRVNQDVLDMCLKALRRLY